MSAAQKSHFELFGLPERFAIDPAGLQEAYRKVQVAVHPDRFAHAAEAQRRVAMQWAAAANQAFVTLRDPVRRAAYLCELRGAPIAAESNTAMPADFLMQQMSWREALEEARDGGDREAVEALRGELQAFRADTLAALEEALDVNDDPGRAASLTRELMFLDKFAREIDEAASRFD